MPAPSWPSMGWGCRVREARSQVYGGDRPIRVQWTSTAGAGSGPVASFWRLPGRGGPGRTGVCWVGKKGWGRGKAGLVEEMKQTCPEGGIEGIRLGRVEHRGTLDGQSLRRAPVGIPDPQLDLGGHRVGEGGAWGCRMTLASSHLRKWLCPSLGSSGPEPQTQPSSLHSLYPPSSTIYP